jgi:hypothetical protein
MFGLIKQKQKYGQLDGLALHAQVAADKLSDVLSSAYTSKDHVSKENLPFNKLV